MSTLAPARKEALRLLLKSILAAGIAGARAMERHILNAGATGKLREQRMNDVCAELLGYHLWRACKLARQLLPPSDYVPFATTAANGLAVAAAGIFTGLYDKSAQRRFIENLQQLFVRYDRCSAETLGCREPITCTCPIATLSRTLAALAGRPRDDGTTLQAFVIAEQSVPTADIAEHMAAVARSR